MKSLSFITPIHPGKKDYFVDTYRSVLKARESIENLTDWETEWVVVADGPGDIFVPEINQDKLVFERLKTQSGVATARGAAVDLARGDYILPVDADDLVDNKGLLALIEKVETHPEMDWFAHDRVLIDGSPTVHVISEEKIWRPGELQENWKVPFAFHPNSILAKRQAIIDSGKWPDLAASEDHGLIMSLNHDHLGIMIPEPVIKYRVWDGQTVAGEEFEKNKPLAFKAIESSINQERKKRGREPISAPPAFSGSVFRGTESNSNLNLMEETAEQLAHTAEKALDRAYSPYSNVRVSAAVMDDRGRVFIGCNIENASYGLTMCAERVAVAKAVSEGATKIIAVGVVSDPSGFPPCGACRQFIAEFADDDCPVFFGGKTMTVGELLPGKFGQEDLI